MSASDHRLYPGLTLTLVSLMFTMLASPAGRALAELPEQDDPQPLYDPDPEHLWNQLHHALFVRPDSRGEVVGFDEVDPLLWHDTTHLLDGPSHESAQQLLDRFLSLRAAALIEDPLKRAVLQHDLWSVFDWLAQTVDPRRRDEPGLRELRMRLAAAMRDLALNDDQIRQLPDTWQDAVASQALPPAFDPNDPTQAFLPPDLFDESGPWVCLNRSGPDLITARLHAKQLGSRSVFLVFLRLPGSDRDATLNYLKTLNLFKRPVLVISNPIGHRVSGSKRTPVRGDAIRVNPDVPQFPTGTQLALVRRMLVINDKGDPVSTGIVEMVQTRAYLQVNSGDQVTWRDSPMQAFHEVRLQKLLLLSGKNGGLAPVTLSEPRYLHFFAHGEQQQFARGPKPLTCVGCHRGNGIHSVNTYAFGHGLAENLAPRLSPTHWNSESDRTIRSKRRRYEWGLLQGLRDAGIRSRPRSPDASPQ